MDDPVDVLPTLLAQPSAPLSRPRPPPRAGSPAAPDPSPAVLDEAAVPAAAEAPAPMALPEALSRVAWALAGVAIYGFALRTADAHALPGLGHALWALALPGSLALAWVICLPALYVFWGAPRQAFGARQSLEAAAEALRASGAALGASAPVLWFFAVTAPRSRILAPLGLAFVALALLAGGSTFGQRLRRAGAQLPPAVQWAFALLAALTFAQFSVLTGIRWR